MMKYSARFDAETEETLIVPCYMILNNNCIILNII